MAEMQQVRVRTFSSSNLHASKRIHEYISNQGRSQSREINLAREVTKSSMILPTLRKNTHDFDNGLARYTLGLVADVSTLASLEEMNVINWCQHSRILIPLNTESDGNCLLHSLSIYIWGVHDRGVCLRTFLHHRLQAESKVDGKIYKRWKFAQEESLNSVPLTLDSVEMRHDWNSVVDISSTLEYPMGNRGTKYAPLEDIHVFAMSNILARPIVVLSEKIHHGSNGVSLQPNQIGGIYLPLLRNPVECEKSPVVIGYLNGHFVPLLSGEDQDMLITNQRVLQDAQHCIPLVYSDLSDIPIRFMLPNEQRSRLLTIYLDYITLPVADTIMINAAMLKFKSPPAWSVELMFSLYSKAQETFSQHVYLDQQGHSASSPARSVPKLPSSKSQAEAAPYTSQQAPRMPYSQASTAMRHMPQEDVTTSASASSKSPCIRVHYGCQNIGEERYNNLCKQCYQVFVLQRNQGSGKNERAETPNRQQRPGGLPRTDDTRLTEQPERVLSSSKKCIILQCPNQGKPEYRDLCLSCHEERVSVAKSSNGSEIRAKPSVPLTHKVFCADPGCQEEIVPGKDKCEFHIQDKPNCITEGCRKKAIDNDFPLCSECRKKNLEATEATLQAGPASGESTFNVPQTYPGYSKINSSIATSSVPKYPYSQPVWQTVMERNRRPNASARICRETTCGNFAATDKQGLCNECFDLMAQFGSIDSEARRDQVNLENATVGSTDLKRDVKEMIGSHIRKAAGETAPSHSPEEFAESQYGDYKNLHTSRRNSERVRNYESERKIEAPRSFESQRNYEDERNYGRDRRVDSPRKYESQRNYEDMSNYERDRRIDSPRKYESQRNYEDERNYERERRNEGFRKFESQRNYEDECNYERDRRNEGFRKFESQRNYEDERNDERERRNEGFKKFEIQQPKFSKVDPSYRRREGYRTMQYFGREEVEPRYSVSSASNGSGNMRSGFDNAGYQPGIYSMIDETAPDKCVSAGCSNLGLAELKGLCDQCHIRTMIRASDENTGKAAFLNTHPCKRRGCPRFADEGKEFCETCFERNIAAPVDSFSAGSSQQARVCITPFCDFFASGEYGRYCSKCFLDQTKKEVSRPNRTDGMELQMDNFSRMILNRGAGPGQVCRREGCDLFGRPERDGFCSQCYDHLH